MKKIFLILVLVFIIGVQCDNVESEYDFDGETARRAAKMEKFMEFMFSHGTKLNKNFSLVDLPEYGIATMANENIAADEVYLTIPNKLLMGESWIRENKPDFWNIILEIRSIMGKSIKYELILFILHEKLVQKENSFWWPYLDILPESYPNQPVFWKPQDLEYLQGSTLYQQTLKDQKQLKSVYSAIKGKILTRFPDVFPPDKITFDEFAWAQWTYNSRLFFIEGLQPREHMVPLADLINCEDPVPKRTNIGFVENAGDHVVLKADRNFESGTQIFESYGYKSNAESLKFEGFVNMDAVNDCIWLDFPSNERTMAKYGKGFTFCLGSDLKKYKWPQNSLMHLRLFYSDGNVSDEKLRRGVSYDVETKVWQWVVDTCKGLNASNPWNDIPDPMKNHQRYLAIKFRVFEKRTCNKLMKIGLQKIVAIKKQQLKKNEL